MFSTRTNWQRKPNRLTALFNELRDSGKQILDLTVSNPSECGFTYPSKEIIAALGTTRSMHYQPEPQGIIPARKAVCNYYKSKELDIAPHQVFLTASTSEGYSTVFKLLCNAGDDVLIPKPSYPLFDFLAQINDVHLSEYSLRYDGEWHIDIDSLVEAVTPMTKAICLIHPHNPTGMFIKKIEYEKLIAIATERNLALIVDEVFLDYGFEENALRHSSTAGERRVLTFTMNGISKMIGLPQMKLGWIVLSGPDNILLEASHRLEILCDTFLSVNTPVQEALAVFLKTGDIIQDQIRERTKNNFTHLSHSINEDGQCSVLQSEGGWYGIIRVPRIKSDEEWCIDLLKQYGVYLYPGYFFDFVEEGYLIVSLLVEEEKFKEGVKRIEKCIESL
ncbi:MAG: pyridoxal phosphate-dependent aminotransferase [Bacteroidota bacterium]